MQLISINLGRPRLVVHDGRQYSTAIGKRPARGLVPLTEAGLQGDHQADKQHHGGADLAVCLYAHEHYPFFAERLGSELEVPSFGENFTATGLLEEDCCIGDVFKVGRADAPIVQITQPREPCVKLQRLHNCRDLMGWIHESGYTGFYLRVLQAGTVAAGDVMERIDRPHEGTTVRAAMGAMFADPAPRELIEQHLGLEHFSARWKQRLAKRVKAPA